MILTAMRGDSPLTRRAGNEEGMSEYYSDAIDKVIFWRDEDYETAEIIGNKDERQKRKESANEPRNVGMINGKKMEWF